MTSEEINYVQLEALLEDAKSDAEFPGEWTLVRDERNPDLFRIECEDGKGDVADGLPENLATFIVALTNSTPGLIEEVLELRRFRDSVMDAVKTVDRSPAVTWSGNGGARGVLLSALNIPN